jgi:alpha-L-fucosidase
MGVPGELKADFTTPEQYIPKEDASRKDTDAPTWEACETIGSSWGYYRGDRDIKSPARVIADLVRCVSNNGNLLLNVGPTPRGRIQPEFIECLKQVGAWMDVHGESIYQAGAATLPAINNGCPERHYAYTQRGNDLYLHFFDRYPPADLIIPGLKPKDVDYMELVSDRTEVEFAEVLIQDKPCSGIKAEQIPTVRIKMPVINPDPYDTVIRIKLRENEA